MFDDETNRVITDGLLKWRHVLGDKLREAAEKHPTKIAVDLDNLADLLTVVFEGAFVLSRSVEGRGVFSDQVRLYRTYLELLFEA